MQELRRWPVPSSGGPRAVRALQRGPLPAAARAGGVQGVLVRQDNGRARPDGVQRRRRAVGLPARLLSIERRHAATSPPHAEQQTAGAHAELHMPGGAYHKDLCNVLVRLQDVPSGNVAAHLRWEQHGVPPLRARQVPARRRASRLYRVQCGNIRQRKRAAQLQRSLRPLSGRQEPTQQGSGHLPQLHAWHEASTARASTV